jgi:hypothetical protein
MKSLLKGIASFDHVLTEEDVLRYNAGIASDEASVNPVLPEALVLVPAQADEAPPPPPPPPPPADEAPPSDDEVQLTDEDLIKKLESENTEDALATMAQAAGVDQSGTKAEIAARLVAHYRSQQ